MRVLPRRDRTVLHQKHQSSAPRGWEFPNVHCSRRGLPDDPAGRHRSAGDWAGLMRRGDGLQGLQSPIGSVVF